MPMYLRRVLQLALLDVGANANAPDDAIDVSELPQDAQECVRRIVYKTRQPREEQLRALLAAYQVHNFDAPLADITPQEQAAATVTIDTVCRNPLHIAVRQAHESLSAQAFWVTRAMQYPSVWYAAAHELVGATSDNMFGASRFEVNVQPWTRAATAAVAPVLRYLRGIGAYCYIQYHILSAAVPQEARDPLMQLYTACKWLQREYRRVFDDDENPNTLSALEMAMDTYKTRVLQLTDVSTHQRGNGAVTLTQTRDEMRHAWRTLTKQTRLNRAHAGVMYIVRAYLHMDGVTRAVALLDRMFGDQWSAYLHQLTDSRAANPRHALDRVGATAYSLPPLRAMHAGYAHMADDSAPRTPNAVRVVQNFLDEHQDQVPATDVRISALAASSPLLLTTLLPDHDALPPDALYEYNSLQSVRLSGRPRSPPELRPLFEMLPRYTELWACLDKVLMRCRRAVLRGLANFEAIVNTDGMSEDSRRVLLQAYCKQHGMPYKLLRDVDATQRGVPVPQDPNVHDYDDGAQ